MKKVLLIGLILSTPMLFAKELRSDIERFKLLSDRHGIDQELKGLRKFNSYFSLDISLSSGLRKIVNDISDATEDDLSDAQKDLAVYKVLTQNLNTDKFIYLDLMTGAPLPFFKVGQVAFLPNIFAGASIGANFTIHNTVDALNPEAQTYLKMDKMLGLRSKIKWQEESTVTVSTYYLIRQDLSADASYTEISDDGEIVDTNDLEKSLKTQMLDLSWQRETANHLLMAEVKELRLYKYSSSNTNGNFGASPLWHARLGKKWTTEALRLQGFIGSHWRSGYQFGDGLYTGVALGLKNDNPFGLTAKMDRDFLTFMPHANFKHLHVSYSLQTAFRNPQDDIWASSIHTLALSAPF